MKTSMRGWLAVLVLAASVTAASGAVKRIDPAFRFLAENPKLTGEDLYWLQDEKSGCWVFNPLPMRSDTATWSGACQDKLATGEGVVMIYRNGKPFSHLSGVFRRGSLSGPGVSGLAPGEVYEGEFAFSARHGHGVLTRENGDIYDGLWPGNGTYTRRDGVKCGGTVERFGRMLVLWSDCAPKEPPSARQ